jgi:hypothetical protein
MSEEHNGQAVAVGLVLGAVLLGPLAFGLCWALGWLP